MSASVQPSARYPSSRYSGAAIILHWLLAALLLFQLSLGWRLDTLDTVPQFIAFQLHKSVGIAILLLSLARLAMRLVVRPPAPVPASRALGFLASATHVGLYAVMIGGPLTGWLLVSTAPVRMQTLIFGLVPWPDLPFGSQWNKPAAVAHQIVAWLFVGLVVLHVAGALRHHLLRDDVIGRMMPRAITGRRGLTMATIVALLGGVGALAAAKYWPFATPAPRAAAPIDLVVTEEAPPADVPQDAGADTAPVADPGAAADAAASPATTAAQADAETATPAAATATATATATPWQVQAGGKLGFRVDYSGMPIEGSFKRWDAEIVFDPEDLPNSTVSVSIDLASVDSADSERDTMLASDSFFDTAAHPRARFRSTRISHRTGKTYRAAGTLSLHGQQRPVTLDFTLDIKGDEATATGSATVNRMAFGVGSGQWASTDTIPDPVAVTFSFKATRKR
ncbi:MAG TPA: YceI family protein [Sphingobium sp.]|nr:YceI family protein [Sphingobium sp.]